MSPAGLRSVAPVIIPPALWFLLTAFLTFYTISELPQLQTNVFRATVVLQAACAAALGAYALLLVLRRRFPQATPLDIPLLLLAGAFGIAVLNAVNPRIAWETALPALFAVTLYFVASDRHMLPERGIRWSLLVVGLIAALRALMVVGLDYRDWVLSTRMITADGGLSLSLPPAIMRVHNVGDNPNVIATIFAVLLPLAVVSTFIENRMILRLISSGIALSMALALFFTLSRAAWVGAACGLLTAAVILPLARAGRTQIVFAIDRRFTILAAAVIMVLVLAFGGLLATGRRPDWLFRQSLGPRIDAVSAGAEMWRDHPLTGVGPAGYALLYPEYSGRNPLLSVHAHNGYVQAGAELGLVGVTAIGLGGIVLMRTLIMEFKAAGRRLVIAAVICGGIAFLVQSTSDATFEFKSVPAILAVLIALGLTRERETASTERATWRRLAPGAVFFSLALVLISGWLYAGRAHSTYAEGLALADAGRWADATERFESAVQQDPENALYHFEAGIADSMARGGAPDGDSLRQSLAHLEQGLELEPRSVIGWTNYGRLLAIQGDREAARSALQGARRFGGQDLAAQINAGITLEELGFSDEAIDAYVQALVLDSELISSPFWSATDFRRANRRRIIAEVNARLPLLSVANPAFDLSRPASVTPEVRTRLDVDLRQAQQLLLSGRTDQAREIIDGALARQPDRAEAHALRGDLYDQMGQLDAARESWFTAGSLGDVESLRKLGDSYEGGIVPASVAGRLHATLIRSGQFAVLDGTQYYWIGIQYYRSIFLRGSPRIMLLPGEWQNVSSRTARDAADALNSWNR